MDCGTHFDVVLEFFDKRYDPLDRKLLDGVVYEVVVGTVEDRVQDPSVSIVKALK